MKIIRQIGIIFLVCWLSEVIESFLPFTFPASVIGMALLLACLLTGVLKIRHIQEKADFLLENMAFFFIPAGVSIINYFDVLKSSAVQLIIICVVCGLHCGHIRCDSLERETDRALHGAGRARRHREQTEGCRCAKTGRLRDSRKGRGEKGKGGKWH